MHLSLYHPPYIQVRVTGEHSESRQLAPSPSGRLGASALYIPTKLASPSTGFPLETVQVRGQADPYTQRKCDGAPRRRVVKDWSWELGHTRPTGCRGQARAESTADTEAEAREMASLPGRWMTPSQAPPPRSGGPAGKGCSPPRRGARSTL
jgi:hypothetical protein